MLAVNTYASPATIAFDYAYLYSETPQTFSYIQSQTQIPWQHVDEFPSHGFRDGEYWLRVHLENTSHASVKKVIRFNYPSHDEVDVYELDRNQQMIASWQTGDMRPSSARVLTDKHSGITVTLKPNEIKWVYARVSSVNALVLSLSVMSEQEHQTSVQIQGVLSGLIYGVLLVMALYNFCLAVSMRDKAYYVYVLYVMTFLGFILTLTGDGYYYLWTESPQFNRVLLPVVSGFLIIPSLFFPFYLLNVQKHAPNTVWFFWLAATIAALYLIAIPIMGIASAIVAVNTLSIIFSVAMLGLGIYLSVQKIPLARLYTFAWFILLSGLAVLSLASLGVVENNLVTRNAGLLGGVIEVIILSLALARRISQERNDKMQAVNEAMRNRKLFQELFDQAPIGIVRFNLKGTLVTMNPMLTRMMGFESQEQALSHVDMLKDVITDHKEVKNQLLAQQKVLDKEMQLKNAQGEKITCSVSLHFYEESGSQYIEAYVTDIRERIEAQSIRDYMEQERLASMEQLVTGVAHEINTPLGVNITSVSHIKEILDEVDNHMQHRSLTRDMFNQFIQDSHQLLEMVTHNLDKISNLVRRFKLVSVTPADKISMNFKQHLELSLHSHLFIGHNVNIDLNCMDDLSIESYPAAWNIIMEQLLENSMVHGFSAEQIQKKICINVTQLNNEEVCFDYKDNGQGVVPEIAKRVFDPFVTTKRSSNDHAGLGLYRVYNLVHRVFDGDISLQESQGFHLRIIFKAPSTVLQRSA